MNGPITNRESSRGRGVVVVSAAFLAIMLLGCAALAVDMGAIYNAKAELQRTADAAAMAAAYALGASGGLEPTVAAKLRASEYTANNLVWGQALALDEEADVTFGRANFDAATGTYVFTPGGAPPDTVRVRVRKTADSPNGAFGLYFAGVFGLDEIDLSATATAMMIPRDIAIVTDLSGSHSDDSEVRHFNFGTSGLNINLHEVWDAFPGGIDGNPQTAGPLWGYMKEMGWGSDPITGSYDPTQDPGLMYLPYAPFNNWVLNPDLDTYLAGFVGVGYSSAERAAISYRRGYWKLRVAVAMGMARWDSGISGGLWERLDPQPPNPGNGDVYVTEDEMVWLETVGGRSPAETKSIWLDDDAANQIQSYTSYMAQMNYNMMWKAMDQAGIDSRYLFGAKTFMNYLMERRPDSVKTPELADAPTQPMQAVKDSVQYLADLLTAQGTNDQLSLEVYGTTAIHEMDLTQDFASIAARLNAMQAVHYVSWITDGNYDGWTNIGQGITRGTEELTSVRARSLARKVMVLLTDGVANVNRNGETNQGASGDVYAIEEATVAANLGIQIYTITVGTAADTDLMAQIAEEIGHGRHFHASGTIDNYSQELSDIFVTLGGLREVELID